MTRKKKFNWQPYLYALPAIVLVLFWIYKPFVEIIRYSFYDWNMLPNTEPEFVGLENFRRIFNHPDFIVAVKNTVYYIFAMIPFSIVLPLFISVTTQNMGKKAKLIFRFFLVMPLIIPPVVSSTIFQWMLHPTNGIVNKVFKNLNITSSTIAFLGDADWARRTIAFISGWKIVGFGTLMFSAGLSSINKSYYEAARLDGASKWRQFTDITLPLLSPTFLNMITMSILFSNQWSFSSIDNLTKGGPFGTTTNIYYLMYEVAFNDGNVGMSAVVSLIFIVVLGLISLILQKIKDKLVFYDV